ncbi:MAG TPA: hypothetical protein VFW49_07395, partial [Fluviicoccus sp.]|nr:hypothetical protein [Fluviicoccus sp.]
MNYMIAIVDYNKRKSVEALIAQLVAQSLPPSGIRVVDNAAQDIPGRYHSVKDGDRIGNTAVSIIIPDKNLGYSKGCNLAAAGLAGEEFVVFLSPDIEVRDPAFFESFFAGIGGLERVGCIGVAQRNPDGSYEQVPRKLPTLVGMMG